MGQRYFTTYEIAKETGMTEKAVRNILYRRQISPVIVSNHNGRKALWGYTAYKIVMERAEVYKKRENRLKQVKAILQKEEVLSLEELRKLHPLVKDDRFFKTSYFPDIIPKCFEDFEED